MVALAFLFAPIATAKQSDQQNEVDRKLSALNWQAGPGTGDLGGMASIGIPSGFRFLDKRDAGKFLELLQNPASGRELGVLVEEASFWFVVFEFSPEGYVKDDDRNLDADAILASIKKGTEAANKIRRERGWSTLDVTGWQQKPFYDQQTNNLTWAIRGRSEDSMTINHSTRLLGRRGVMNVDLVVSPEQIGDAMPTFSSLLSGFSFASGHRYAEFTRGDKVAEYGLTGLIVGGAGVALVKTGLLQKLWKFIVLAVFAAIAGIKRFTGFFRRREQNPAARGNV